MSWAVLSLPEPPPPRPPDLGWRWALASPLSPLPDGIHKDSRQLLGRGETQPPAPPYPGSVAGVVIPHPTFDLMAGSSGLPNAG